MTASRNDPTFTAETFQNPYLSAGAAVVDAVVTVKAADDPHDAGAALVGAHDRAEVIVIDTSGSMGTDRKLQTAKAAAAAALDCLDDGVACAVVAGTHEASLVWPTEGTGLGTASPAARAAAKEALGGLRARGGTAIGTWLDLVRDLCASSRASSRHAVLLTDGRNESRRSADLAAAVEASRGVFQCDCRGVGVDWEVGELRSIASALLGTVDMVPRPEKLDDELRAIVASSQARVLPGVKLRVWAPQGATVTSMRQVAPEVVDLTAGAERPGPLDRDFLLGGWSPREARDYHLRIEVSPGGPGDEMLAGRVSLVLADDTLATQTLVKAIWTDDPALSTRVEPHVAHYTGQVEMADSIAEGLAAAKAGDEGSATLKLGRAVRLADESGHTGTLKLLAEVVDVDDAGTGTVRLRRDVGATAEMMLDSRSTRTVRLRRDVGAAPEMTLDSRSTRTVLLDRSGTANESGEQ